TVPGGSGTATPTPQPTQPAPTSTAKPAAQKTTPRTEEETVLTKGSKGEAVVRLQKALQAWNSGALPKHGPDGSYGNETIEWVKQYQQEMGLQASGNIDGITAALLVGAS
ncbi:MAG: peptidoglycan-binding protein, partial [Acidimicrobiia bacterium]|nr:peptidoglycan-binding protein [Acidimicrobiia bacterium]